MYLIDVGVYNAMREKWGSDFYKKMLHSGGSAGTVFAVALALGKSPEYMNHLYSRVAINTRKYSIPIYYGSYFLEVALHDLIMSDPFAYKKLEGRCCFGTTSFFATHRWHVSWESNDDLIACIQASYNIPIYCKRCVGIKDVVVVDGAYGFAGKVGWLVMNICEHACIYHHHHHHHHLHHHHHHHHDHHNHHHHHHHHHNHHHHHHHHHHLHHHCHHHHHHHRHHILTYA